MIKTLIVSGVILNIAIFGTVLTMGVRFFRRLRKRYDDRVLSIQRLSQPL